MLLFLERNFPTFFYNLYNVNRPDNIRPARFFNLPKAIARPPPPYPVRPRSGRQKRKYLILFLEVSMSWCTKRFKKPRESFNEFTKMFFFSTVIRIFPVVLRTAQNTGTCEAIPITYCVWVQTRRRRRSRRTSLPAACTGGVGGGGGTQTVHRVRCTVTIFLFIISCFPPPVFTFISFFRS